MTVNGFRSTPQKDLRRTALFALLGSEEFKRSPCKRIGPSNLWVDDRIRAVDAAKATCAPCPARAACARYALEYNETEGVWGGLDPAERRSIRRRRARQAAAASAAKQGAAVHQALANLTTFARPDGTVVRTPRQLEYVKAIAAADGNLKRAREHIDTTHRSMCHQYRLLAVRAGLPDSQYDHVPDVLARIAVVLAEANLGQAA
ncbi:WhiB family transcriptional regulator [Kitasatospora sp. NPDC097605]|uniref:WhiB family transcriptional regulator n=1 Tax=Kitasatospora sp. NPDC097605 TaxID=3157226 RepID=UPI003320D298